MFLNFIFFNLNMIALVIWVFFFGIICILDTQKKKISYKWLVASAIIFHLFYGFFATWGQYIVWSKSEFTKILLLSALPKEVPFPLILEWIRPLFNGNYGYFAFYAINHFFLSIFALFVVTGFFTLFFKLYCRYYPDNFKEADISIIAISFLIAGWPGVIVLVPLSFIIAIIITSLNLIPKINHLDIGHSNGEKIDRVSLSTIFFYTAPFALLFVIPIFTFFHLYTFFEF